MGNIRYYLFSVLKKRLNSSPSLAFNVFELQLLISASIAGVVESLFFHISLASSVRVVGQGLEKGNVCNF